MYKSSLSARLLVVGNRKLLIDITGKQGTKRWLPSCRGFVTRSLTTTTTATTISCNDTKSKQGLNCRYQINDHRLSIVSRQPFSTNTKTPDANDDDDEETTGELVDPKERWMIHDKLKEHIRTCMISDYPNTEAAKNMNTGFCVCFLGTGSGKGSDFRANTSTALKMDAHVYLFDSGEGVQRQFNRSRLTYVHVRKIFITHMHIDHVAGLVGFILNVAVSVTESNKKNQLDAKPVLQIYGPVGLYDYIAANLMFTFSSLNKDFTIEVNELHGSSRVYRLMTRTKRDYHHPNLIRKEIPMNDDRTWIISEAGEIESEEDIREMRYHVTGHFRSPLIMAAEIDHVPKLQCFGYFVREPITQPRNIDAQRAQALGARPSKKYEILRWGFPVQSDDGERWIQPSEVYATSPKIRNARSLVVLGDCCNIPEPMAKLCQGVDLLIHEATHSESESIERQEKGRGMKKHLNQGGHTTAAAAGRFADRVQPSVLLLNHISASQIRREASIVEEAERAVQNGRTRVQLSYDHLEIQVPKEGFKD